MDIPIENLWPTEATTPIDGTDTLGNYIGWKLTSEYQFTQRVPTNYFPGQDISLVFEEASDGESLKHKWQITVVLNGSSSEIFIEEETSDATEDTPTEREIEISTDGQIDGTDIAVGDIFFVSIKRIAASEDEDSNVIRMYTLIYRIETAEDSVSTCYGDVGALIDETRDLMNDTQKALISDTQMIRAYNAGLRYLGRHGYLRQESPLNITGGVGTITLMTAIPGFTRAYACRYYDADYGMRQASSWEHFQQLLRYYDSGDEPLWWFILTNILYFTPVPATSVSNGLYLLNAYKPNDLTCYTNYTLPFPLAHGDALVAYAMWTFHNRFFTDDRIEYIDRWWRRFLEEAQALLAQPHGTLNVRPAAW